MANYYTLIITNFRPIKFPFNILFQAQLSYLVHHSLFYPVVLQK
jgi:hypothetical protein